MRSGSFDAIYRKRVRAFDLFCKGAVSTSLLALLGCEVRVDAGLKPQSGTADTPTTDSTGSTTPETDPGTGVESDGDENTPNTDPGSDPDGSVKFDLMVPDTGTEESCDPRIDPDCNCGAVDILFVVDNSFSANRPQESLAEAFPPFMAAIVEAMPGNTNIHVGITSTTMGYTTQSSTENCFSPDADDWYHPPDTKPNTEIAAQGRLHEYDGRRFFEIDSNATQDQFDELNEWFANAVLLGSGGSQVTMSTAAAAWALDQIGRAHV